MLAEIEKLPGVAAAYPDAHVKDVHVRYGDKETNVITIAMPPEAALLGISAEILIAGRLIESNDRPEAILGTAIVTNLGFKSPQEAIGKEITVEAAGLAAEGGNKFEYQKKELHVTVVGVYSAPSVMPGKAQEGMFLPVEIMKQIPGIYFESAINVVKSGGDPKAAGYASATVRVRDPKDIDGVEKSIHGMGFHTQAILAKLQDMRKYFFAVQVLLTVVGTIALTIAALGIANTLLMAVLERYQEIGLCKAIGASDGDLFVLFLTEAGIIGLLGGLTGIAARLAAVVGHGGRRHLPTRTGRASPADLNLFAFPSWLLAARDRLLRSWSAWWPASIRPCAPRGSIRSGRCARIKRKRRFYCTMNDDDHTVEDPFYLLFQQLCNQPGAVEIRRRRRTERHDESPHRDHGADSDVGL